MSTPNPVINLFDLNRSALEHLFESTFGKRYRARQIMKWAYKRQELAFDVMTDISVAHRAWLTENASLSLPEIVSRQVSIDGTVKWVVRVANGNCVETVLIPDKGRNTLCVSSQVGCTLDCSFCATGKQGFNGNLSAADIIGQVWLAERELREKNENVSNVVLMGMGEPLLNLDAVLAATDLMTDDLAFGLSKRRVTVSTSGVVPGIYELAKHTDVSLAISLHAPNDALRNELVPINKKYPLAELMEACKHYLSGLGDHRTLTIEYTLLRGVNDSLGHAKELAKLLEVIRCKINLIPFNPFPASGYERPGNAEIRDFQTYLMNAGYTTMLRTTRGDDIHAACGQLVGQVADRTKRQGRYLARVKAQEVA